MLLVRLQQHAVEQIFYGDFLPRLKSAGDILAGDALHRRRADRGHGVRGELAVRDGFHYQKGGHHLGDAGGVGPLVGLHVVEQVAVVGVQQGGVGAEEVQVVLPNRRGGERQGEDHGDEEQGGKKTIFFHRKFSICML